MTTHTLWSRSGSTCPMGGGGGGGEGGGGHGLKSHGGNGLRAFHRVEMSSQATHLNTISFIFLPKLKLSS